MDEVIKICAKYLIIIPVLVEIYLFWKLDKTNRRQLFSIFLGAAIISLLMSAVMSQLYNDPRPQFKDGATPLFPHANDNGFPSDHTLLASLLAFVAYRFNKRWGYGLLLLAVIIGWARVAAHVHHAVDIAGSLIITAVAYLIMVMLAEKFLGHARTDKSQ